MALLRADMNGQLGMIVGKYVMSGGCTDVIGGTMTAGTMSASALITFAPPFISAPTIVGSVMGGIGGGGAVLTASNYLIGFTGVTVSNAYLMSFEGSGCVVSIQAIGLQKL
jgi:hypothetical protein